MKDFKAKAYFNGNQKESGKFPNTFDGYFLDRLDFSASVQSYKDIDDLITFLKIHRQCFITPQNVEAASEELVDVGDLVEPKARYFMPYWNPGAIVMKVGTPKACERELPKYPGGDWVIISSYGGWLPRIKFKKQKQ